MDSLEKRADAFAEYAHRGQVRKYTGEPYITHPREVAALVKTVPHTDEMIAAALLHDVVEDTAVTNDEIEKAFGSIVAIYVWELTDVSRPKHGNRAKRKAIDRAHTALASAGAQTIRCADIIHNGRSIRKHGRDFWPVFSAENRLTLELMTRADEVLHDKAMRLCKRG